MKNAFFAEGVGIKQGYQGSFQTAQETTRLNMAGKIRVAILFMLGAGVATNDFEVTLRQHKLAAGGDSKNLAVNNPVFYRVGETGAALLKADAGLGIGDDQAAYTIADLETSAGLVVVEVLAEELDINNDFKFISAQLGAAGAARQVNAIYLAHEMSYGPAYEQVI